MIPPEPDLVKVPGKVLLTQIMKYALSSSLENRIKGLCCIIMDISMGIFILTMVCPIMGSVLSANGLIRTIFISHQMNLLIDKVIKLRAKLGNLITVHKLSQILAVTFHRNQHSMFGSPFTAFMFSVFFITGFATNIFFIQFNHTAKCRQNVAATLHHLAYRMANFTDTFLRDSQH